MKPLKLLFLLTITFLFSCSSIPKEIKYELVKVDHGELFDVVFRVTNNTDQTVTLDEPREGACATLTREWKYVKDEDAEWKSPLQIVGTAMAPPVFTLGPGEHKDFMLSSAMNKKEIAKAMNKEKMKKVLFRVWYTSTNEEGIYTNVIELND